MTGLERICGALGVPREGAGLKIAHGTFLVEHVREDIWRQCATPHGTLSKALELSMRCSTTTIRAVRFRSQFYRNADVPEAVEMLFLYKGPLQLLSTIILLQEKKNFGKLAQKFTFPGLGREKEVEVS